MATANKMQGMFCALLYDNEKHSFYVIRDHMGIIPGYIGYGWNGEIYVASELKCFHD